MCLQSSKETSEIGVEGAIETMLENNKLDTWQDRLCGKVYFKYMSIISILKSPAAIFPYIGIEQKISLGIVLSSVSQNILLFYKPQCL